MDIYVVGHGFIKGPEETFGIPPGCSVNFYCKEGDMFDSKWEGIIRRAGVNNVNVGHLGGRAVSSWEKSRLAPPTNCKNYILTRPGNMKTAISLKDMKAISTDLSGKVTAIAAFVDGDTLCIKNGGKSIMGDDTSCLPYTDLACLMKFLFDNYGAVNLHWFACRSAMEPIGDIISQAKDAWKGIEV